MPYLASNAVVLAKSMVLRLNMGLDGDLNPMYSNRSWRNVKNEVTDDMILTVGTAFGGLTDHTLNSVSKSTRTELQEV